MKGLSFAKVWAVARYELTWDLRKKRTYLIVGIFLFAALYFGYILPVINGKSITTVSYNNGPSVGSDLWWVTAVYLAFNYPISGVFPILIGGFISADSLGSEFDSNTIVPLLSQPVRRLEVYAGKFVEKLFLLLFVSAVFTLLVLATSEISVGAQSHLEMFPLLMSAQLGAFLDYAALAFFFGSFVRSGTMVLEILVGVFFVMLATVTALILQIGEQVWTFFLPVANADFLLHVVPYYIFQPSGTMILLGGYMGNWSPPVAVASISALEFVAAGLVVNLFVALVGGYYIFRRAEVKE